MSPLFSHFIQFAKGSEISGFCQALEEHEEALRADESLSRHVQALALYHGNSAMIAACVRHTHLQSTDHDFLLFRTVIGMGDPQLWTLSEPPAHCWENVVSMMCVCDCFDDVVSWCQWKQDPILLTNAISCIEMHYANWNAEASEALVHLKAFQTQGVLETETAHAGRDTPKGLKL